MAKVLVTQSKLDTLAGIIGGKSSTEVPLTLDEMITAADSITSGGGTPNLQAKTYTVDSAGTETIEADEGYDGLSEVEVTVPQGNMAVNTESEYYTENNNRKWRFKGTAIIDSRDGDGQEGYIDDFTYLNGNYANYNAVPKNTTITPTTSSQTIGGANYMMEGAVTVSAMPTGTAGTPTATKGAVSSHSISVTPSVTNTTGYITGSTKTGTAVSVSASELVSGTLSVTTNGQQDVTNYQYVDVNVSGGGGGMTVATATATPVSASSSISFTGLGGEPTSFAVISSADLATGASPYKTAAVVFDGTNLHGQTITNTNNAQVSYDDTHFSKTYSSGTLTITGSTYWQANEYKLIYTYGGNSANIGTADVQVGSGATSITFTGLTDEPDYFSCIFKSNFATSSGYQRVIAVVYDGNSTYGLAMDSGAKAESSWSYTYNNGSLTVSSTGTNNGGYFHQPGYYQLTYGIGGTVEPTEIEVEPLSVTQNGTYTAPTGKAYSPVTVNVSGGGGVNIDTKSVTNSSNQNTSISFTSMKGQPKAFFARCTSSLSRSSSNTYYYVADMVYDGTSTVGNMHARSTGQYSNITSGYSWSYSGTTLTLSSSGARGTSPGSFYNGTYEVVYVY